VLEIIREINEGNKRLEEETKDARHTIVSTIKPEIQQQIQSGNEVGTEITTVIKKEIESSREIMMKQNQEMRETLIEKRKRKIRDTEIYMKA
jgi:hypothetical protein